MHPTVARISIPPSDRPVRPNDFYFPTKATNNVHGASRIVIESSLLGSTSSFSARRRSGALRGCVGKRRFNSATCAAKSRQRWHSPPPLTASFMRCISCAFFNFIVFNCSPMAAYCTFSRASSTTHKLNTRLAAKLLLHTNRRFTGP